MEIWKEIKGYEGLYAVSSMGRVKSLPRTELRSDGRYYNHAEKILKPITYRGGYVEVHLRKVGEKKVHKKIHRLVAEAFIPNPSNLPMVNHKNECKTDNRIENLEWCDNNYNHNYGTATKRQAIKKGFPVRQYDLNGEYILTYRSICLAEQIVSNGGSGRVSNAISKGTIAYGSYWEQAPKDLFYNCCALMLNENLPPIKKEI